MTKNLFRAVITAFLVIIIGNPAIAAGELVVSVPEHGAIFKRGDYIVIEVSKHYQGELNGVAIYGTIANLYTDDNFPGLKSNPPYQFTFKVPDNARPKQYNIIAVGTTKAGQVFESAPVDINIDSGATPLSLKLEFTKLPFEYLGQRRAMQATVTYDDDTVRFVDSRNLRCASNDPSVVITTDSCEMIAAGAGSTSIVFSVGDVVANAEATVKSTITGDYDGDGDVDTDDINILNAFRNRPANPSGDARDLNGDGKIDALDLRILTTRCTRSRCATQ